MASVVVLASDVACLGKPTHLTAASCVSAGGWNHTVCAEFRYTSRGDLLSAVCYYLLWFIVLFKLARWRLFAGLQFPWLGMSA